MKAEASKEIYILKAQLEQERRRREDAEEQVNAMGHELSKIKQELSGHASAEKLLSERVKDLERDRESSEYLLRVHHDRSSRRTASSAYLDQASAATDVTRENLDPNMSSINESRDYMYMYTSPSQACSEVMPSPEGEALLPLTENRITENRIANTGVRPALSLSKEDAVAWLQPSPSVGVETTSMTSNLSATTCTTTSNNNKNATLNFLKENKNLTRLKEDLNEKLSQAEAATRRILHPVDSNRF